jgi:hypothetical protein
MTRYPLIMQWPCHQCGGGTWRSSPSLEDPPSGTCPPPRHVYGVCPYAHVVSTQLSSTDRLIDSSGLGWVRHTSESALDNDANGFDNFVGP